MKNLQKLFSMAMLVCMAVAMFSCSKDDEEITYSDDSLIGEWTIIDAEIKIIGIDSGMDAKTYPENSILMFSSDNTYKIMTQPANVAFDEGSWTLEGKNVILTNKLTKMGKSYEIKALTDEGSTLYHKQTSKLGDSEVGYSETVVLEK
jgi:hypothetical protein